MRMAEKCRLHQEYVNNIANFPDYVDNVVKIVIIMTRKEDKEVFRPLEKGREISFFILEENRFDDS